MVLNHEFQDVLELIKETEKIDLPTFKQSGILIEYNKTNEHKIACNGQNPPLPFACSEIFYARICNSRRLSAIDPKCKDIYEISFNIENSNFNFKPGDTIGIIPHNIKAELDIIVQRLELEEVLDLTYKLSVNVSLHRTKIPVHIPVQANLKHVLTHCVDLRGIIKKAFLLALSKHTTDDSERKILEYLCSEQGASLYRSHILNKNMCLTDIFTIFKSCKPPVAVILEHLPRLLPRPYSIANSSLKDKGILKICFSVMDIGNSRKGITTSRLEELVQSGVSIEDKLSTLSINKQTTVPIYLRKNVSEFSLPQDLTAPLILVGHGTGVAPFLGFLQEIDAHRASGKKIGFIWLFFGCRDPKFDYIYKDELQSFVENGVLSKFNTAFSRSEVANYVQDDIIQNSKEIANLLLKQNAYVYVCGDINTLSKTIKGSFVQCLESNGSLTREDAETYIADCIKKKRYRVDVWS